MIENACKQLQLGILLKDIEDGDIVLFNRQPSCIDYLSYPIMPKLDLENIQIKRMFVHHITLILMVMK